MTDSKRQPAPANPEHQALEGLELAFEGLALLDGDRVVRLNAPFAGLLGLAPEALLGEAIADRLTPGDALAALATLEPGRVVAAQARRADGTSVHVELRRKPLGETTLLSMREMNDLHRVSLELASSNLRATTALKSSESRYRQLVENAVDVVLRLDRHGRFLYANPVSERVAGIAPEQLVGRTYREVGFPPALCDFWDAKMAQAFSGEAMVTSTFALPTPAGLVQLEFRLTPERNAAGAVETVHAVGRDISELKRMAATLRERDCQLSTLIANLPGMAYRCHNDARWTMAFVSEGCLELTGYAPDDFIDNRRVSFDQLYHPADHARIWDEVQDALAARRPFEVTYRIRDRFGRLKWIWEKGRGVFGDDGALLFLEGLLMDVSATKELADQLARREAQLQEAQQIARLGSWEWDVPTGALTWSDEHFRLLGLAPGAVAPSIALFVSFVHPEDAEVLRRHLGDLAPLRAKPRFVHDCRLVRADGEVRHVHARGEAAFDAEGRLSKVTGTLQDVTEWRRVETELLAANETLTRLGAMKDEFLSTISHELRTPLAAMQSAAAVLLKGRAGPLSEVQQRFVTMVRDHGAALQRLVDDMLDYQQLKLEDGPTRHAPSDVRTLVSAVAAEQASAFESRGLTLSLALPDEAVPCRMDRRQIAQVLRSLLSNAAKFTPAGGRVTVEVAPRDADVHLIVRDTGRGIPPDGLERVFEKFMQLDGSLTRPVGGAGLGLALCKQIVEVGHGGRIWAESTLGVGTALHVALPAGGPDAT